jgi:hypothetical protein
VAARLSNDPYLMRRAGHLGLNSQLDEYCDAFASAGLTELDSLFTVTAAMLAEMPVKSGHIKKLLKHIVSRSHHLNHLARLKSYCWAQQEMQFGTATGRRACDSESPLNLPRW